MSKQNIISDYLISILSNKFGIDKEKTLRSLDEPLNSSVFQFDAINLVYFILELQKLFQFHMNQDALLRCASWSIQDYILYLLKENIELPD